MFRPQAGIRSHAVKLGVLAILPRAPRQLIVDQLVCARVAVSARRGSTSESLDLLRLVVGTCAWRGMGSPEVEPAAPTTRPG